MPRFEVKRTGKLNLTSYAGLALIGQCCQAAQVDAVLAARGWQRGTHFTSLQFDGGDHNEAAWRSRVRVPLQTLLAA